MSPKTTVRSEPPKVMIIEIEFRMAHVTEIPTLLNYLISLTNIYVLPV